MYSTLCISIILLSALARAHGPQQPLTTGPNLPSVLDYVNPLIGTDGWSGTEYGGMIPNVAPPFAMTQWSPMTRENWVSRRPYHHRDTRFHGFIGTHQPAIWMGDYGYVVVSPGYGTNVTPEFDERGMRFEHEDETARAGYYSVRARLEGEGEGRSVWAEATASCRAGVMRFTWVNDTDAADELRKKHKHHHDRHEHHNHTHHNHTHHHHNHTHHNDTLPPPPTPYILIQATRLPIHGQVSISPSQREISGHNPDRQDSTLGPFRAPNFKGFFVARFSANFTSFGTVLGSEVFENRTREEGAGVGAWVRFGENVACVEVQVGTSFVSVEQARRNLEAEGEGGFGGVRGRTEGEWEEKLGRVTIQGGRRDMLEIFYTGLYHSLQYPSTLHESTTYYSGILDTPISLLSPPSPSPSPFPNSSLPPPPGPPEAYTSYSTWDVFRAQWALLILFAPERVDGMVGSMLRSYKEGGWLPIWESLVETNIMVGTHADSMIAEALAKGFHGFDTELAWQAVRKNALVPPDQDVNLTWYDRQPHTPHQARAGLTYYMEKGWVAADKTAEAGSRTLDYAYDDWCVAQVALLTGHADEAAPFLARSGNYRNVFHDATGFMEARRLDGSWAGEWVGWTEGDRWKYTFSVMHDVPGLVELMGRDRFISLLTEYWVGGHNQHDNEPSHHIPYLWAHLGGNMTSKTQAQVRRIAREEYSNKPDGLSGNEDCGQMSAWYVLSALGIYPVSPASATYTLGTPFFDRVSLRLPGRPDNEPLIISAPGAGWKQYVKGVWVDGRRLEAPVVRHGEWAGARSVWWEMSEVPVAWG